MKTKKFEGVHADMTPRPKMIRDTYMAVEEDLKELQEKCEGERGCKSKLIRLGVKLALQVQKAKESGKHEIVIPLDGI